MAADTFFFRRNGLFYDVVCERTGEVVEELLDCVAEARNYAQIHTERAAEAEAAEQAELASQDADYRAESDMLDRIYREVAHKYDAGMPETAPANRAVKLVLEAIDGISKPAAGEMAEAA